MNNKWLHKNTRSKEDWEKGKLRRYGIRYLLVDSILPNCSPTQTPIDVTWNKSAPHPQSWKVKKLGEKTKQNKTQQKKSNHTILGSTKTTKQSLVIGKSSLCSLMFPFQDLAYFTPAYTQPSNLGNVSGIRLKNEKTHMYNWNKLLKHFRTPI